MALHKVTYTTNDISDIPEGATVERVTGLPAVFLRDGKKLWIDKSAAPELNAYIWIVHGLQGARIHLDRSDVYDVIDALLETIGEKPLDQIVALKAGDKVRERDCYDPDRIGTIQSALDSDGEFWVRWPMGDGYYTPDQLERVRA